MLWPSAFSILAVAEPMTLFIPVSTNQPDVFHDSDCAR
jgi:hypothetical protein